MTSVDIEKENQEIKKQIDVAMVRIIENVNDQTNIIREALKNKEQKAANNTMLQIELQKRMIIEEINKKQMEKNLEQETDPQGDAVKDIEKQIVEKTLQYKELSKQSSNLALSPTPQPGIDIESLDKQLQELEDNIIKDFEASYDNLIKEMEFEEVVQQKE